MRRRLYLMLMLAATAGASCGPATTTPSTPQAMNVSGAWSGDLTTVGAPARMTWTLTQTGTSASGPVLVVLSSGTVLLNGSLTGTVNNLSFTYTIAIAAGGIPTQPLCTGQLAGSASGASTKPATLTGVLNLTSSTCPVPIASTPISMIKTS
jgi:hypothetical protein